MSFIGGYQSDVNLNNLNFVGDFPLEHSLGGFGISTGLNNYELAVTPAITQYRQGMVFAIMFAQANTGPVTININGRGVKDLKKIVAGALLDLEANDLSNDKVYLVVYDGVFLQIANSSHLLLEAAESRKGISQIATTEEVNDGEDNTKIVTPSKLAAYIADKITGLWEDKGILNCSTNPDYPAGQVGDAYTVNVAGKIGGALGLNVGVRDIIYCNVDNPGGVDENVGYAWTIIQSNLEQATDFIAGYARLATQGEVNDGINNSTIITPFKLKTLLDSRVATEILTGLIELATQAEVNAGLDDNRAVTSLKLMTLLNVLLKYQAGAGLNSIIPKLGVNNTAPGSHAVVLAGNNNRANNTLSSAMGSYADAWQFNELAKAPGAFFNTQGSVQHSVLNIWNIVPSAGGIYPITLDGAGASTNNRWKVPNNSIIQFMLQFTIIQNSGSAGTVGDTWTAIYEGVAKNVDNVVNWVGGAPSVREIRQDAGLSPSVSFSASGNEIIPIVIAIFNRNLHVNITAYITQTKFNLS